jgi:Cof subfamily protein (haloacid dehalogenase superfamily)
MNNVTSDQVKTIFLDLDGTTLNEKGIVNKEVEICLRKLQNLNISVYLVSGRSYESMFPTYLTLGLKTQLIAYNGAQLVEADGHIVKQNLLNPFLVEDAIRIAKKYNNYIQFYIDKKPYYIGSERIAKEYFQKGGIDPLKLNTSIAFKEKCTNGMFLVSEYNCDNTSLVNISNELENSILWKKSGSFFFSSAGTLEFSNKGISKANMISHVLGLNGIKAIDTIAIGDGLNDKEMILKSGLGIAMGNASDELKAIADLTIRKNSENGVSQFLNIFFNLT